jgi:hypothetical protein
MRRWFFKLGCWGNKGLPILDWRYGHHGYEAVKEMPPHVRKWLQVDWRTGESLRWLTFEHVYAAKDNPENTLVNVTRSGPNVVITCLIEDPGDHYAQNYYWVTTNKGDSVIQGTTLVKARPHLEALYERVVGPFWSVRQAVSFYNAQLYDERKLWR